MYCPNCGNQIDNKAEICVHCGVRVKSNDDNPSTLAGIASCCFPIVGLILYLVWKNDKPQSAKSVCHWTLGGLALGAISYLLGMGSIFAGL